MKTMRIFNYLKFHPFGGLQGTSSGYKSTITTSVPLSLCVKNEPALNEPCAHSVPSEAALRLRNEGSFVLPQSHTFGAGRRAGAELL